MKTGHTPAPSPVPAFATPVVCGQHNLPTMARFEAAMRGIFERRYYTNHGPLAREFEERLQSFLGVKHAIAVTNATIGLMMACEAVGLAGKKMLVPGVCNTAVAHTLFWCGIDPVFCDVDRQTGHLAPGAGDTPVDVILATNLWGDSCDPASRARLARQCGVPVLFDSAHAFGCEVGDGQRLGGFGELEVFAFDAPQMLNAGGAACVATNDDELAARLRNIRSSYGAGRPVPVVKTSNGRMSEAQAAMGLLSLDDYAANRERNRALFNAYRAALGRIPGVRVVEPVNVTVSNHQALVCEIDGRVHGLSRDTLIERLAAHNVQAGRLSDVCHMPSQAGLLPVSEHIGQSWLTLPLGAHLNESMVDTVCSIVAQTVLDPECETGATI
jgi:dTDP-4-amino-4,6-dideoxygalactose transaminase